MSDHRTVLLYVPAKCPEEVLHEFILTHREGDTGQDAWQHLVMLVAVRENPLTALIHRLWIEAGGDATKKVGEVTEGELLTLIHMQKQAAAKRSSKEQEEKIVLIRDHKGEPELVFPGTPKTEVAIKLSALADHVRTTMPFGAETLRKAVATWFRLKVGGKDPV